MAIEKLFTPVTLGGKNPIVLQHRISMAPLTRLRAGDAGVQPEIAVKYYGQRATEGGLIIAEATNISPTGRGYFGSPGIFSQEQIDAWKVVNDAVHAKGGKIFLQLWHTGRIGHPKNQPNGELPVSSSANMETGGKGRIPTRDGREAFVAPRALETNEIPGVVKDYQCAAENAIAAGFDGVELHAANGYLPEQFLQDGINDRTDKYGGSVENRARFLFEALEAILEKLDSSKVGIRLSPYGASFGQMESDPFGTYSYVFNKLNDYDLAYAHIIEPRSFHYDNPNAPKDGATRQFRPVYKGVLMTASGYDRDSAVKVVEDGDADIVAIGRYFISNPDVVKRFQLNAHVRPYDPATFYLEGELGYTDQPFLEEEQTATVKA
uniref:NADH:flavin oxidoreductase/NADH oxidase N-terminal domain-containing protein n=1 Tax=Globisporangium ultimum (strain ATCC 200006 / CBS 805.95 / DAOM BR144) TaxID=431595 RepID=K3WAU9_GLOUD